MCTPYDGATGGAASAQGSDFLALVRVLMRVTCKCYDGV